eukprot:Skav235904  [mRNA]  locus=scaffold256:178279:188756:+ [translate_table: standard]
MAPKDLRVLGRRLGSSLFLRRPSGLGLRAGAPAGAPFVESHSAWGKSWTSEPSFRRWSSSAPMVGGCLETYLQMKAAGEIKEDPRQEVCMKMLDDLAKQIDSYSPKMTRAAKPVSTPASGGGGLFGGLFGGKKAEAPAAKPAASAPLQPVAGQRGLYLKRIHFHEWMIDVHSRLHKKQKGSSSKTDSSADDMVEQVAAEAWNWPAWRDGTASGVALAAGVALLPEVHDIGMCSSRDDEDDRVYLTPNGENEKKILEAKFEKISNGHFREGVQVESQGRRIVVPRCAMHSDVAFFSFPNLCDKPLGAADYLAVGHAFHTATWDCSRQWCCWFIACQCEERDQVRRFITLIDTLYETHTKLVCTAALDPIPLCLDSTDGLCVSTDLTGFYVSEEERKTSVADEIFAWDRTVSRLMEAWQQLMATACDLRWQLGMWLPGGYPNDFKDMWRRYDLDDNGVLDMDELHVLLEDLLERQCGHRNLSDEPCANKKPFPGIFYACRITLSLEGALFGYSSTCKELFDICVDIIDKNKDGEVSFDEFQEYLSDFSTIESTMSGS